MFKKPALLPVKAELLCSSLLFSAPVFSNTYLGISVILSFLYNFVSCHLQLLLFFSFLRADGSMMLPMQLSKFELGKSLISLKKLKKLGFN